MKDMDRLGPWPEKAVATFRDLGLTVQEIARYFGVHPRVVREIERDLEEGAQRSLPAQEPGQMKSGKSRTERGLVR